jgi:hypothetical protein
VEPENIRSYECTMAGTQDGDTVSLRSCNVDACYSAPDVVTLVTLNLLVCIRNKNTVAQCASPVYDIIDPTVHRPMAAPQTC